MKRLPLILVLATMTPCAVQVALQRIRSGRSRLSPDTRIFEIEERK